jgi:hypothetical protein
MEPELLVPGVEHTEEANLGPEMSGIAGDFEKSFCTGTEQQIIDDLFILQSHGGELRRQSEHDMNVTRGEKFATTCGEPPFPSARLTFRTVAIATTVVGDGGTLSTAGALIDMAAECGGATAGNGQQDFDVRPTNPLTVALDESSSCRADQVGHLQERPTHLLLLG